MGHEEGVILRWAQTDLDVGGRAGVGVLQEAADDDLENLQAQSIDFQGSR